ncbi:MAG: efflux RND transporter permease subunit, partial [Hyphomicrobiaceae bacterium]
MLSRFFIDRPNFAFVISMVASLVGAIAITLIPISEYPDITPPQVVVSANFPGANAALIEKTVAIPIEQRVNGVEDMLYMSSTSSNDGKYKLTVTFRVGTDPDIAAVNVQNRVSIAQPLLPASVKQQGVTTTKQSSNMLLVIALTSPDSSRNAIFLSNYASTKIQDRLTRIPGVGTVSQFGPLEYSMRVWFNPQKLTSLGLTASDVSQAIQAQNIGATAGQVGAPPFAGDTSFEFVLQGRGLLDSVEAFRDVVVKADAGKIVKLSDIARVELGSRSYSSFSSLDNRPATAIAIYQSPGANALDVADRVYSALKTMKGGFPSGIAYTLPYDITRAVRASIEEIIVTLGITAVLVVAVVFLFLLSWRAVLIPTIAIPVSLLGTIGALYLIGFSANLITLFGLILAITLVVDDAIIIVENTERIMEEENLSPREATLKAMSQVTGPIIATTFVLAAVFIPVCFFPGITGRIYLQFALTITIAFTISALNALTLTPVLCANLLKRSARSGGSHILRFIPATVDRVRDFYVAVVRILIRTLPIWLIA